MRPLLPVSLAFSFLSVIAAYAGCSGVALPPGAVPVGDSSIAGIPSSCTADGTYFVVTAADCGFAACHGTLAYALCDGSSYSACTCTEPTSSSGWTKGGSVDLGPPDAGATFPDVGTPPPHKDVSVPDTATETSSDEGGGGEAGTGDGGTTVGEATAGD